MTANIEQFSSVLIFCHAFHVRYQYYQALEFKNLNKGPGKDPIYSFPKFLEGITRNCLP